MAQTPITVTQIPANYSGALNNILWQTADTVNGNSFPATGGCILLVQAITTAETGVIDSVADAYGRTGNITMDVPAGDFYVAPMLPVNGFGQSDGTIHVACVSTTTKLAVLQQVTG